ncbi:hypothetical protein NM688_g7067 [Phlebia brevispora]|uniref:Uncharacterized protein n=1 Tax=Phlebia brevispora TaxID=194682 RepID=A0ACC1S9M3_9APHY|nr:hypothetical protein NM688_g7067 [Phlebia brevispora]
MIQRLLSLPPFMPQAIFTIALLPFTCARWFLLRLWYTLHSTLRRQDHFAPHPDAAFEGFYSRTQLSNGGTLAVVFCWVHKARKRPNLIHISYTPVDAGTPPSFPAFKHELFPESVVLNTHQSRSAKGKQAFTITMHGVGSMTVDEDSVEYDISCPSVDLHLTLQLTNRVPWAPDARGRSHGVDHRVSTFASAQLGRILDS